MVKMTTCFDGLTAILEVCEEPDSYGQYPATLHLGELAIFCSFPTLDYADDFMMSKERVIRLFDQASRDALSANAHERGIIT